jgi:hypothetical protein
MKGNKIITGYCHEYDENTISEESNTTCSVFYTFINKMGRLEILSSVYNIHDNSFTTILRNVLDDESSSYMSAAITTATTQTTYEKFPFGYDK